MDPGSCFFLPLGFPHESYPSFTELITTRCFVGSRLSRCPLDPIECKPPADLTHPWKSPGLIAVLSMSVLLSTENQGDTQARLPASVLAPPSSGLHAEAQGILMTHISPPINALPTVFAASQVSMSCLPSPLPVPWLQAARQASRVFSRHSKGPLVPRTPFLGMPALLSTLSGHPLPASSLGFPGPCRGDPPTRRLGESVGGACTMSLGRRA